MLKVSNDEYKLYEFGVDRLSDFVGLRSSPRLTVEEANASESLGAENIIGFGFGVKTVRGVVQDGIPALCAFVVRKARPYEVVPRFLIENLVHDYVGAGLYTDVIEAGRPGVFAEYNHRIPGGALIKRHNQTGPDGTLGCWLIDKAQDKIYLLSCWHCLDGGQKIPLNRVDILHGKKKIGTLTDSINPEQYNQSKKLDKPTVDAAVAELGFGAKEGDFILHIGEIFRIRSVDPFELPLPVRKYGALTGLTSGAIKQKGVNMTLDMKRPGVQINANPPALTYDKQMIVFPDPKLSEFSLPGDSGALVVTEDYEAVGLLVGGKQDPTIGTTQLGLRFSVVTPIQEVLNALKNASGKDLKLLTYPLP
jgi:hypothetical protein